MSQQAPLAPPQRYTVDELAARSGLPSRTIRFYQSQGILAVPLRHGRIALYGDEHVERLRLVALLQARGLRLSAIRDLIHRGGPESLSLHDWLGLDERLRTPWTDDEPHMVSDTELRTLLADHPAVSVEALQAAGLAIPAPHGARSHTVPSPALLHITLELEKAGIDFDTAVAAGALMRERLATLATQLVGHFVERVGAGFGHEATPAELARAFDVLRPLGVEAVGVIFAQEVQRALRGLLDTASSRRTTGQRRRQRRGERHERRTR